MIVSMVTDGSAARGPGLAPEEVVRVRAAEAQEAVKRLGVDALELWALPEMGWAQEAVACRLRETIKRLAPDVIYAHSLVDYHPEHRKLAAALAQALEGEAEAEVRVYELGVPLGRLANVALVLGGLAGRRQDAVRAYSSQRDIESLDERRTAYNAALFGLPGAAEVYWQMPAHTYVRLMSRPPGPMYRSLRERPLTDPLAYVDFGRRRQFAGRATGYGLRATSEQVR